MLAQRTGLFATSGTANARAAAQAAAASGKEVIDLTAGEIWADLAPTLRAGAIAAIERGASRYTDTIGLMELRQAVARKVSFETGQLWHADEIAVTTGAKQALFNAAMVLLNPGDEVIVPAPYWTTFPAQVLIAGGRPVFVDSRANSYVPRLEDLRAAVTPATRAIIVNTPGNPTGVVYDHETLCSIAELAIAHNLWVIFDECYGGFVYEPFVHEPIVSAMPEIRSRLVIINAFSKHLAITGWRIGYLAGPREVVKAVKALQSHTTSNPNVIAQHAVLTHLEASDGAYERQLRAQLRAARLQGLDILSSLERVPLPSAQGGFYFYLDVSELLGAASGNGHDRTADEVVNVLLTEAGVAVVSGTAFGDRAGLRLSYGGPVERLTPGLQRVVEVLNAWR
jgi:aspartate aminotransferase